MTGYRVDPERLRALLAALQDTLTRLSRSAMELDAAVSAPPPGTDEVSLNAHRELVRTTEEARARIADRQGRLLDAIALLRAQLRDYEAAEREGTVPA